MARVRVEPLIVTPELIYWRRREWWTRIQWFALGMSATCIAASNVVQNFLQVAIMMGVVALIIGTIKRLAARGRNTTHSRVLLPLPQATSK